MSRPKSILAVLVLVTLVLLAVSGVAAAAPLGGGAVNVINNAYQPANLTIQVGDTVTWTRVEGFHNVRSDTDLFMNAPSSSWTTFSHTFDAAGTYEYYCEVHSSPTGNTMNGSITVQAPTAVTTGNLSTSPTQTGALWALGAGLLGLGALAGRRLTRRA